MQNHLPAILCDASNLNRMNSVGASCIGKQISRTSLMSKDI